MSDSRVWRELVPLVLGSGRAPRNDAASTGEALKWRLCCTKYKCSKVAFAMEKVAQAMRRLRYASAVSTRRRGTSQRRRGPRCCAGAGVQRWNLMSRVFSITHKGGTSTAEWQQQRWSAWTVPTKFVRAARTRPRQMARSESKM